MTTQTAKPRQDRPQATPEPYGPIALRLGSVAPLTDELLAELSSLNDALRLERNADGDLEILPPVNITSGNQESNIVTDLMIWARSDGKGVAFGPNAGFTLPSGAVRAPDASWILKTRLAELTDEEKRKFAPLCPDFVIELRSSSDPLTGLQCKMEEYIANGARLGWLIDPLDSRRRVYVYRSGAKVEVLERPESLSGEPELPGFTLELTPIWEPDF